MEEMVQLPGQNIDEEKASKYLSPDIGSTIEKKHISTVVTKETSDIKYPSFLVDFSELDSIMPCVMSALRGLLRKDGTGDTTLYVKIQSGILEIGNAKANDLYRLLELYISTLFGDKCKVYRNKDGKFKRNKIFDVNGIRLGL